VYKEESDRPSPARHGALRPAAFVLEGAEGQQADRVARAPLELMHPHECSLPHLLEALIFPYMMHVDRIDIDRTIPLEGRVNLIGAPKGDVLETHKRPLC
jgi:hypothetical protein